MKHNPFPTRVRPIWQIKARRSLQSSARIALRDFLAPLTDDAALLNFLLIVVTVYTAASSGLFEFLTEIAQIHDAALPLGWAILMYAVICVTRAPFRAHAEESACGQWVGNRYILNTPKLVFQKQISAADSNETITFEIPEAEPGGGVEIRTEIDVWDQLCFVRVVSDFPGADLPNINMRMPLISLNSVTGSKRFRLLIQKRQPSNATVVKVFLHSLCLPQ